MEWLKVDADEQKGIIKDIKTKTGRGPQNDHAGYLEIKIQKFVPSFSSSLISDRPPEITATKEPPVISIIESKAKLVEGHL